MSFMKIWNFLINFLLIPLLWLKQIDSPFRLNDFQPISLLKWPYKIEEKVLASTLIEVLLTIVLNNQSKFIHNK